ncbi:myb-like protein P, partial [Limulus polyphemus]|uniref:Myb-like protein P n=1 Tax=Limulus polyphemus TaxID=6850 RepID=A0ABM1BQP2_LIMPO
MRIKYKNHLKGEEGSLLQSQQYNQQLDSKGSQRTKINSKIAPENFRIQTGWHSFQDTEKQHYIVNFNNNKPVGYNPSLASPLEDGSDQAMSLSSPEIIYKNNNTEEESLSESELDFNQSKQHLETQTLKQYAYDNDEKVDLSDDCNNNSKNNSSCNCSELENEDSLFSDLSDSPQDYLLDHSENISNNNYTYCIGKSNSYKELSKPSKRSSPEKLVNHMQHDSFRNVAQQWEVDYSQTEQRTYGFIDLKNHAAEDYLLTQFDSPNSGSSDSADLTPMSENSSCSDFDINMATETLNNFSMSTSKHSDIQCLVNKDEEAKNANIRQMDSSPTCLEEAKILNTASHLPKNMTEEYQEKLKNKPETEITFSQEEIEKCELDCSEKEIGKKECCTESFFKNLKTIGDNVNMTAGKPEPSTADDLIGPLLSGLPSRSENTHDILCENSTTEHRIENKVCSSPTRESGENILKLLAPYQDNSTPEALERDASVETPKCSVNCTEKQAPTTLSGTKSKTTNGSVNYIKPFQIRHPKELAVISSFRHESKENERSLLWNFDEKSFLFSDNTLNNNSITNSVLYKSMAEKVTLPPTCFPSTTRDDFSTKKNTSRYSLPIKKDIISQETFGSFDVYNIETTMPKIDWTAMEEHLSRAANESNWYLRRQHDREEIRRKLAMDSDSEDYYCGERVTKKPSLSTRLQSGMNLQICFMNETASDQESLGSDHDTEIPFQKESTPWQSSVKEKDQKTDISNKEK